MLALHRWAFFLPLSLVASTVFVLSLYYPRVYRATASFERKNDPVMMNLPMSAGAASFEQYRSTMARDLTSLEYMREVVDNLELAKSLPRNPDGSYTKAGARKRDSLARSFAGTLSLVTVSPTSLLDITNVIYTGPDPILGRRLAEESRSVFIRRTKERIHAHLTDLRKFWIDEAQIAAEALRVARREETAFRLENPHSDPNHPGGISLRLAQLHMERRDLELRKREYESELVALQQMLAATMPMPVSTGTAILSSDPLAAGASIHPDMLILRAQMHEIDTKIQELMRERGMTSQHPEVKVLLDRRRALENHRTRIHRLEQEVAQPNGMIAESPTPLPPVLSVSNPALQGERTRFLVQVSAQRSKLSDVDISLTTNASTIEEVLQAKRMVYENQEDFAAIMERVAKARKDYTYRTETVATIDPALNAFAKNKLLLFSAGSSASGSLTPISPKATTVILLAILAGIASGVLCTIIAEVFDHVYRSSAQVARSLGLPMLETIDEIVTAEDRRFIFIRRMVLSPLVVVCFAGLTGLTASMAYLSIVQPSAYLKLSRIPQAFFNLFTVG